MLVTLNCHDGSMVSLFSNGKQNAFLEYSKFTVETSIKSRRAMMELGIDDTPSELQDFPINVQSGIMILSDFVGLPANNKLAIMFTPNGYVFRFFGLTKDLNETVREMKDEVREFVK